MSTDLAAQLPEIFLQTYRRSAAQLTGSGGRLRGGGSKGPGGGLPHAAPLRGQSKSHAFCLDLQG